MWFSNQSCYDILPKLYLFPFENETRHAKKHQNLTHVWRNKQARENAYESEPMSNLMEKDFKNFKVPTRNILKALNDTMLKYTKV